MAVAADILGSGVQIGVVHQVADARRSLVFMHAAEVGNQILEADHQGWSTSLISDRDFSLHLHTFLSLFPIPSLASNKQDGHGVLLSFYPTTPSFIAGRKSTSQLFIMGAYRVDDHKQGSGDRCQARLPSTIYTLLKSSTGLGTADTGGCGYHGKG